MNLQDLIERIEAADGPSKEINRAIAKSRGWHRVEPRFLRNSRGGWIAPEDFIGVRGDGSPILDSMHGTDIHQEVPSYTSSIDAAMTLVPVGWRLQFSEWDHEDLRVKGPWQAILERNGTRGGFMGSAPRCDHAKSPAIALCAAALRVRMMFGE